MVSGQHASLLIRSHNAVKRLQLLHTHATTANTAGETGIISVSFAQVNPSLSFFLLTLTVRPQTGPPARGSFAGYLVACVPWDRGVSQEKNISPSHVCFSDQGSPGGRGSRTGRREAFWLPDWHRVKASVSAFKHKTITGLSCGRRAFLLPSSSQLRRAVKLPGV